MSTTVSECKELCFYRCLKAVALSVFMQFFLLTVFLLFVNFHVFHLLNWITETISLMFSFYTWLSIVPLILAVIVYGILLGKSHLAMKYYYPTRFRWLLGTVLRKTLFFIAHILVGLLTAILYAKYLHVDYRSLVYKCYGMSCINANFLYLVGTGISAGCYHFVKEHLRHDPEVEFPLIQETRLVKLRSLLYTTLYKSLIKSFMPSLCYALIFWLFGDMLNKYMAHTFDLDADTSLSSFFLVACNLRLLFYSWILSSQILSNMNLMQKFFSILLAEELHFPIEKNVMLAQQSQVTLVEALAMPHVPVIQHLAALEVFCMTKATAADKRKLLFSLSMPGGHPYNWNQLSAQCLALINGFTEDLTTSVKNISTMKSTPLYCQTNKPTTATEAADKILLRQYNEIYGIRRMVRDTPLTCMDSSIPCMATCNKIPKTTTVQRINKYFDDISMRLEQSLNNFFRRIPGLYYMFAEPDGAKTAFLLCNSQIIVWLSQGLAGICAVSLIEDNYGVVQSTLPQIIKSLLQLKSELDKLNNVNLNGKKLDRNFIALKNSVKRSLYQIVTAFGDYLRDLFEDPLEVQNLQSFMNYQDV